MRMSRFRHEQWIERMRALLLLTTLAFILAACGNGGGESSSTYPSSGMTTSPANGETNVIEYKQIEIVFNSAMDPSTLNSTNILLLDPSGVPVTGTRVNYQDISSLFGVVHIAVLYHPILSPASHYTVRLTTSVKDASGQSLPAAYDFGFITRPDPGIGTWQPIAPTGLTGTKPAIWTGSQLIAWGGSDGGRYDPFLNTWSSISTLNAPSVRRGHTLVWTGQKMIVWGGSDSSGTVLGDGGIYDPVTDSWQPLPASAQVSARAGHTAVWTGSQMLVWGGYIPGTDPLTQSPTYFAQNTGALYDPVANTWQSISVTNAPPRRYEHTAVWTGSRMIVWGGYGGTGLPSSYTELNSGASYAPATDSWQTLSSVLAPEPRKYHTALWTGSRMMVWGGFHLTSPGYYLNSGGLYDPLSDSWSSTSMIGAPDARDGHAAVWSGNEAIIWGGEVAVPFRYLFSSAYTSVETGGRYNPATNTWIATSITNAPTFYYFGSNPPSAAWTGSEMIIWAGHGGRYLP